MKNETLTSWLLKARALNFSLSAIKVEENKLEELESLIASGLPTYDFVFFELTDFYRNAESVEKVFAGFDHKIVVRFVSKRNLYMRYTFIEKDYNFLKSWTAQNIEPELYEEYRVVINIYDPAMYCGVIISTNERMVIEMVQDENLEKLCHGYTTPWHARFSFDKGYSFRTMVYEETVPSDIREILWGITKSISGFDRDSGSFPCFSPRVGFYEFVISRKDGSLKFIEYKRSNLHLT